MEKHLAEDRETVQQMLHIHKMITQRCGFSATSYQLQPLWYRCLSDIQLGAANALSRAMCDDILQESTFRVFRELTRLGIHPRPSNSGVQTLLKMSRGNDVAFLWFLMEMFYKSEHKFIYEINEQIIMSAIFWLDLNPTLYELDRVLPLPHACAAVRQQRALAAQRRLRLAARDKKKKKINLEQKQSKSRFHFRGRLSHLPYFEKAVMPKYRRQSLFANYPKLPVPKRELPPEPAPAKSPLWTRWFGELTINDGQSIVRSVVHKEIANILNSLHAAKLDASHVDAMCTHHKQISAMEQSLRQNLERIKLEQRQQMMDVDYRQRHLTRRRNLDELDRLTDYYQSQFHEMAKKTRMLSIRKQLQLDMVEPSIIYLGRNEEDWSEMLSCDHSEQQHIGDHPEKQHICQHPEQQPCEELEKLKFTPKEPIKLNFYDVDAPLPEIMAENQLDGQRPSRLMNFLLLGGLEHEQESVQTEMPAQSQCPCCRKSSQLFEFDNRLGNDFRFNYRKLFGPSKEKQLDNEQLRLKAEFIKALDDDVEYLNAVMENDKNGELDAIVDHTVKDMFKKGTEMFNEEYQRIETEAAAKVSDHRLDFGHQYYNADDLPQMKEMLRLGLERVAQDQRYILPTLPDVHCVPLLLDWICSRYGKRYSVADRERSFNEAKFVMDHLAIILRHGIVRPTCRKQSTASFSSSIRAQNEMHRIMKNFRYRFKRHFILSILEMGRIFHTAMQAYQSPKTVSTYYAYMPAHFHDVEFSSTTPIVDRRKRKVI